MTFCFMLQRECALTFRHLCLLDPGKSIEDPKGALVGAARLAVHTLAHSGLAGYPPDIISKFEAAYGIDKAFHVGNDSLDLVFMFSRTDNGFSRACGLALAYITATALDPIAFKAAKKFYADDYAQMQKSLEDMMGEQFSALLTHGDRRYISVPPSENDKIPLEACLEVLAKHFYPENMEITIAGDFDEEELVREIRTYFGAFPSRV